MLAVFSLNSCVEYVDNGTKPDGPEKPEEQKYTAEQANPEDAKYVGDVFEFKAMLNGVDVTASTKFRVNGTNIPGKTYTPVKIGDHSVIATMDNLTANFKFKVLEEEEEPQPTGNRIEYGGTSYPMTHTFWYVFLTSDGKNYYSENIGGVPHVLWAMLSMDNAVYASAKNRIETYVLVPAKKLPNGTYDLALPNEVNGSSIVHDAGEIFINGTKVYDTQSLTYTFAGTGNTQPNLNGSAPYIATANYTGLAIGASSGNSAELFWNGNYELRAQAVPAKAKGLKLEKSFTLTNDQIKKIKIK